MTRITLAKDTVRAPYGTLGNAIKTLREKRLWTQAQLAKRIGVTQPAITAYERGRICPSAMKTQLLAIELNVPIEMLLAHRRTLFAEDRKR